MVRGEVSETTARIDELEDAAILKDIAHMPARVKCAELAWRTLEEDDAFSPASQRPS